MPSQVEELDFQLRSKNEAKAMAKLEEVKTALDATLALLG